MRVKAERRLAEKCGAACFNPSDGRITVFHRKWKFSAHVGSAHALEFAGGHVAVENEVFRAAADAAEQHAHERLTLQWGC